MTRPMLGRELYAVLWPVTDDTRTLPTLIAEAVPLLQKQLSKNDLILTDSPAWAICPEGQDLAGLARKLATQVGINPAGMRLPDKFYGAHTCPLLVTCAPVVPVRPGATVIAADVTETVTALSQCGWGSARIAERLRVSAGHVDAIRSSYKIAYPLGRDGL